MFAHVEMNSENRPEPNLLLWSDVTHLPSIKEWENALDFADLLKRELRFRGVRFFPRP